MRIVCVGGGPGGLLFSLLTRRADPHSEVTVIDRNGSGNDAGLGVVLSNAALSLVREWDPPVHHALTPHLVGWTDIEVDRSGVVVRSTGHGFSGVKRSALLHALRTEARAAGVHLESGREITSLASLGDAELIVASDGAGSTVRALLGEHVTVTTDTRPNRFIWLGTGKVFNTFRFVFREDSHGLWRAHAYPHAPNASTVIVECPEQCWRAAGMDTASPPEAAAFLSHLFADVLDGHSLEAGGGRWQRFSTTCVVPWTDGRVVLLGDAAHTAHFSVGSGTRFAMEDAIALREALAAQADLPTALTRYETERRPHVERLQRAAQASLEWFEHTERYQAFDPEPFAFSLLTRSLRVTHDDLRRRDPGLTARIDRAVATAAERQTGVAVPRTPTPPPMFTPFRLRELVIPNRVAVSPMCQYSATDGTVGDWHLVHLGGLAKGGAGLVIAEMTAVAETARITEGCAGLYTEGHVSAWRRVTEFVHRETPAKIGIQIGHAGRKGSTLRPWHAENQPIAEGGWPLIAPSPLPYLPGRAQVPREMTPADMDLVVAEFARATARASAAGFDMLEVHMAHGYLLASFISPLTNRRGDAYGGALANRLRFPLRVFDACREAWPESSPLTVRMSAVDWTPGGLTPAEAVEVARMLKARGCDAINVSTGQTVPEQKPAHGRLYQTPFAEQIRLEAGIATMAVGAISSFADVNTIVAAGRADLCLLARGHLFDPYWTRHAAAAQGCPLPWPEPYRLAESYRPR